MSVRDPLEYDLKALRISPEKRAEAPDVPTRRWLLYGSVGVGVLIVLGIVLLGLRPTPIPVEIARAQVGGDPSAGAALIASGYVVPHHEVEVGSKVMGKVSWVGVDKGDQVKAGQLLVRLEDEEYRAQVELARGALQATKAHLQELQAGSRPEEIARARADRDDAKTNLGRIQQLVEQKVSAQQQLDDARARYEMAEKTYELALLGPRKEEVEQARAAVQQAQGSLDYAQAQLEATRITAPIDGTVLERLVEKGEMVTTMFAGERGAKSSVVSLADLRDIRVELDINQSDFPRVATGQLCDVVLEAYPNRHYRAQVVEIAPEANRQKGTVQVKVQFLEPDEHVRPEMIARVAFQQSEKLGGEARPAVTIPQIARVERDGRAAVFVVENGRARLQPIQIGGTAGDRLVVAEGLLGGEEVVVRGQDALRDGARVAVQRAGAVEP